MRELLADDFDGIAKRLRVIRLEEGRGDDDLRTADGRDLDRLAALHDIERRIYEVDESLRLRIVEAIKRSAMR